MRARLTLATLVILLFGVTFPSLAPHPFPHDLPRLDPTCPPMGARFRLKASFDLSGFAPRGGPTRCSTS